MQITPVIGISLTDFTNKPSKADKNILMYTSSGGNFSNVDEISGRYIAFKGVVSKKEKEIIDLIFDEINPFLDEYKEICNKNRAMHESLEELTDIYWRGLVRIKRNYSPEAVIHNDPAAAKNLTVPLKYQANLNEYKYLKCPENRYMMSEETKNFAKEIEPQMHNEKLDSYNDALKLMKKVMLDIKNGQSNVLEHTSESFNVKYKAVNKAKQLADEGMYLTDSVSYFKVKYEKVHKESNSTVKNRKIAELHKEVPKMKNLLKYAKEELKGKTEKAETLIKDNNLTENIVKEQLERLEARYKKTADKNLKVLHKYFKEHPELIRNEAMDKQDDEFLKRQEYLNVKLWQHLQEDINDFNEESRRQYEKYQAQQTDRHPVPIISDDPDLPF